MARIEYEIGDPLAEELRKEKTDEIIKSANKEWDKRGSGDYKHFMIDYWREAWERMGESN